VIVSLPKFTDLGTEMFGGSSADSLPQSPGCAVNGRLAGVAGTLITSAFELVDVVTSDPRFSNYRVRRQGEYWLELEQMQHRVRTPVYVVMLWAGAWSDSAEFERHLMRSRSGNYALLMAGTDEDFAGVWTAKQQTDAIDADVATLVWPASIERILLTLRHRCNAIAQRFAAATLELDLERARHENDMLISIGRALSQERDLPALMSIILRRACEVTGADAGSVYTVDGADDDMSKRVLRFVASHNDSRKVEPAGFELPVSHASIVGASVLQSDVLNIRDLYELDAPGTGNNPWGFVHDRSFDDKYHYQTRSVLVVPMISARDEVIGVIQLINKRGKGWLNLELPSDFSDGVVPFDELSVAYITTLASQAGIALENVRLYDEVKSLFDGFVKASVTAIESRDPTTSGHSERVATLTVGLARTVNQQQEISPHLMFAAGLGNITFSRDELTEIQYAALLHDFGKVGVREHVLVKAKKLYEHQRDLVLERFRYIRKCYQLDGSQRKVSYLLESARDMMASEFAEYQSRRDKTLATIEGELAQKITLLDEVLASVMSANEPTVLDQGGFERIAEIARMTFVDELGTPQPFITGDEATALQIRRGSLTESERLEINSHVTHTYNFLCRIPWGRSLRRVPLIAGAHHEKLDGTGYPFGRHVDDIPVAARMMAIADIYDALTAKDRPYKRAMPVERALDVIASDVKQGKLDAALFDMFVGNKVWAQLG
jgi:HD-GYP domain-containing protein (c-di-GMP phosphodiesterase class II)